MKVMYKAETSVRIKNVVGSGTRSPRCGNCGPWIEHWSLFSKEAADQCCVAGCNQKATDGAHVTRPKAEHDAYKTHPYIVPMCAAHNGVPGGEFDTRPGCVFVWANSGETCGK